MVKWRAHVRGLRNGVGGGGGHGRKGRPRLIALDPAVQDYQNYIRIGTLMQHVYRCLMNKDGTHQLRAAEAASYRPLVCRLMRQV